ncbi:MAG: hypothetical protein ACLUZ0_05985 [Coprococcus sp.]
MKEKQKHLTMKELPVTERPYEKCEKNGAGMLSDASFWCDQNRHPGR